MSLIRFAMKATQKLVKEFIRVDRSQSSVKILVREIHWEGPYTSKSTWTVCATIESSAHQDKIDREIGGLLKSKKFFSVCSECEVRKPNGLMCDDDICQSCAEKNHGVVF